MIGLGRQSPSRASFLRAPLYGALVGLVIGCACSYVLTRYGLGVVGGRGDRVFGPAVFARSGLNFYAIQHITLVGAGAVTDALGNRTRVTASMTLPLTIWAAVPVVALIVGGYAAARAASARGPRAMMAAALGAGLIYAAFLGVAARWVEALLDTFLLPEVGGFSANPPQIAFRPSGASTFGFGLGFGVVFACLGGLAAVRKTGKARTSGPWWACFRAVVATALVVQLLIAGAVLALAQTRMRADSGSNPRLVEMLPTAAGLGYAMIHGATLVSSAESKIASLNKIDRPFYAEANLYRGVKRAGEVRPIPAAAGISALLVGAAAALASGRLAARARPGRLGHG
ncbi:MAG: hypothetical protein ACPL7K_05760, partial [Armatimonadota bacterium]